MKITITIEDKNGGVEVKATGIGEDENSTALAIAKSLERVRDVFEKRD